MNHIVGAVREVFYLKCAMCSHQWEELSNNSLRNDCSIPLSENDEIECPRCENLLPIKFEYQSDM